MPAGRGGNTSGWTGGLSILRVSSGEPRLWREPARPESFVPCPSVFRCTIVMLVQWQAASRARMFLRPAGWVPFGWEKVCTTRTPYFILSKVHGNVFYWSERTLLEAINWRIRTESHFDQKVTSSWSGVPLAKNIAVGFQQHPTNTTHQRTGEPKLDTTHLLKQLPNIFIIRFVHPWRGEIIRSV